MSKHLLSITTDPCFIKSFGTTRASLLVCSIKGQNMLVAHQSSNMSCFSSQSIHRYPMKIPLGHCYFSSMDSVHGLICIEDVKSRMPLVWNPTTGQLLPLPKPNMSSIHMNVFLGYDPVEGKHKVLCLPYEKLVTWAEFLLCDQVKNHGGPSELTFSIRVAMLLDDASME